VLHDTTRTRLNTTRFDTNTVGPTTTFRVVSCSQACKNLDTDTTRRASCRVVLARQHNRPIVPCQHEHDSQKKISSETIFSSIQHLTTQIQSQFTKRGRGDERRRARVRRGQRTTRSRVRGRIRGDQRETGEDRGGRD
jgi:hypothetical protein